MSFLRPASSKEAEPPQSSNRDSNQEENDADEVGDVEESNCDDVVLLKEPPPPIDLDRVTSILEPYGYIANSCKEWNANFPAPDVTLEVTGFKKHGGYYYYHIQCALARPGEWHSPYLYWKSGRRLGHIRDSLHKLVKSELGALYDKKFDNTHFAHSFGQLTVIKGTKGRLRAWFQRLSQCLSRRELPPVVAAAVLIVLGAPDASTIKDKRGIGTNPSKRDASSDAAGVGRLSMDNAARASALAANPALIVSRMDAARGNPFGQDDGESEDLNPFNDDVA